MSPFVSLRLRLRRHGRGYPSGEAGVALVEFALVVPFLLLLVFGITDFGRAFFLKNDMTHLANETARYGVVNSNALLERCGLRWTDWNGGTTYRLGSIVKGSDGTLYSSRVNDNVGNDPTIDDGTNWRLATNWRSTTTYTRGAIVGFSDSMYVSLVDDNKGHDPATDDGTHWAPVEKCTIQAAIGGQANGSAAVLICYPNGTHDVGDPLHVTVRRTFNWLINLEPAAFTMSADSEMRIENANNSNYTYGSGTTDASWNPSSNQCD